MSLDQSASDPGGRRALPGRDDDAHAVVTTPPHGAAPGVDHEADEKPEGGVKQKEKREEETEGQQSREGGGME